MFLVSSLSSKGGMRTFNFSKILRGQKSVDSSSRSQLFLVVLVSSMNLIMRFIVQARAYEWLSLKAARATICSWSFSSLIVQGTRE